MIVEPRVPRSSRGRAVMRREPLQRRSTVRVSTILDACAELMDKLDYDQLTTSKIAERAGVPIGSLYQYFPDKRAVVQALSVRNMEAFSAELDRIFGGHRTPAGWRQGVQAMLDAYLRLLDRLPGFGRVRFGAVIDNQPRTADEDHNALIAGRLCELFTNSYQVADSAQLRLAFRMVVEVSDALVALAVRLPLDKRAAVLDSTTQLVCGLLRVQLEAGRQG